MQLTRPGTIYSIGCISTLENIFLVYLMPFFVHRPGWEFFGRRAMVAHLRHLLIVNFESQDGHLDGHGQLPFLYCQVCLYKIEARPRALVKVHLAPSDINTIMPTCTCCKLVQYCTTYMCIHLVLRASEEVVVYIINIYIN